MTQSLVVTRRDHLLPAVLQALAGGELSVEATLSADDARQRLKRARFDLIVIDFATLPYAEVAAVRALPTESGGAAIAAIVAAAGGPRVLRAAVELPADVILLDPLDLESSAAGLQRVLKRRTAPARDSDPLEGLAIFLRGLAHEILNPLMPITAFLQILKRDPALPPELKDRYDKMEDGTKRIEKTVRDLECFARVRKPQRALLDLAGFLRELESRWRQGEPPLAAIIEAPASTPRILGDREQLALAFQHLVGFAAGGDRQAPIELTLEPSRSRLDLAIVGHAPVRLPPRPADALLPYHDNQGSGRPGTLELAAAWGILRSHRATLDVEAQSAGGVRFTVSFPAAPHERRAFEPA
ncbi:MAG: HAMP domain-containing histidine kinase [Planctomycetes bacterium]|nr:HAMP domain-containing histidine kinase [Planctomycetota bacterium]